MPLIEIKRVVDGNSGALIVQGGMSTLKKTLEFISRASVVIWGDIAFNVLKIGGRYPTRNPLQIKSDEPPQNPTQ